MIALLEFYEQNDLNFYQLAVQTVLVISDRLKQDLEKLTDEKEIKKLFKRFGGQKSAQAYVEFHNWYHSLSQEWQRNLFALPFWNLENNQLIKLAHLTIDQLKEWSQEVMALSEQQFQETNDNLLSPRIFNQTVAKFLPKSPKKTLPLGKILEDEDYEVLLNISEYDFTEDTLEEFKGEVSEVAEDDPITEDLFEALQKRGFAPLLILSKTSRLVLESQKVMVKHEKELEEKDKDIDSLKGELQNVNQQLNQHLELINKLTERLSVLEKQGTPVGTLV